MDRFSSAATSISTLALIAIFNTATSLPAFAATPTCQNNASDIDGDGWGWENNRSCITTANAPNNSSEATSTTSSASKRTYPACTDASFDEDSDGWGWENSQTCVVNAATSSLPTTNSSSLTSNNTSTNTPTASNNNTLVAPVTDTPATPVVKSRYPICASTNSDGDGDGWGYENGKSCQVTVDTQSPVTVVATTPPTSNTPVTTTSPTTTASSSNSRYPDCSSDAVDVDNDGWGYENNRSCIVVPATAAANGPSTVAPPAGNTVATDVGVVFSQTFAADTLGLYQGDALNSGWDAPLWHLGFDQGRVKIVADTDLEKDKVMEVTYPAGAYGANGASAFLSDIQFGMNLPESYDELYIAYDIKFDTDFEFVLGGKLPGLCGYDSNQAPSTGCNSGGGIPTGFDGWSTRGMWRVDGALENYVYQANQSNFYGDDEHWNVKAIPGTWHRVQHRVVMNTVGQKNGLLEAWFDNAKVLSENKMEYRKVETIGINLFYFSTFFGGNNSSWAPATDQRVFFDNFVISTRKIP